MKINDVYLVDGKRTAITNFCGIFNKTSAHYLTAQLIKHVIKSNSLTEENIDEVILGQVLTAGCGQNPARQAAIEAGIPNTINAWLVNQMCASGLKSIALGAASIMLKENNIVIAGGQENMSMSPHGLTIRNPPRMGHMNLKDLMLIDGLIDVFGNYHMGITAENLAKKYNISRTEQDNFACKSHTKAANAVTKFSKEILPIEIITKKGHVVVQTDEFIKPNTTMEALSALKPAFIGDGTITAGNAAGINDGAACVLLANEKSCKKHNMNPIARIVSFGQYGVDPAYMGIAPVGAIQKCLQDAHWKIDDLDIIELNEAFSAQVLAVNKEMKWDTEKLNVNGGAIALGHPIGASGARCTITAMYEMKRRNSKKGLVSLCAGGGMGVAMCIELV